jgi:hypothetical protein
LDIRYRFVGTNYSHQRFRLPVSKEAAKIRVGILERFGSVGLCHSDRVLLGRGVCGNGMRYWVERRTDIFADI